MGVSQERMMDALVKAMAREKEICEGSFYEFYKKAFAVLEPGTDYIDNWHVEYLCWIAQREVLRILAKKNAKWKDIIINVPPRTSKSMIFSVALPVWVWIKSASFRVLTGSYALELSESFSFQSISLIRSKWFQSHWEELFNIDKGNGGRESVGHTINDKQGRRKCFSTMSNLTGYGGMIVIVDDPVNPIQAGSEAKTAEVNRFYDKTLPSRLNNRNVGVFFTIMQRLSETDPTQHLLDKGGRCLHIRLPAIADGTELVPDIGKLPHLKPYPDGLLFPGILGKEILEDMQKDEAGKMEFATQYQQKPKPDGGVHLKKEHIKVISPEEFETKFFGRRKDWQFYGDTSMGDSKRSDPTALGVCCQMGRDLYVRRVESKKVKPELLADHIAQWVKLYGYVKGRSTLSVEPKSSGPMVTGILMLNNTISTYAFKFPKGGAANINSSKVERFKSVVPTVASGKDDGGEIFFIDGPWLDSFVEEVTTFPNARHDDKVDILTMMATDFAWDRIGRMADLVELVKIHN